MAITEVNADVRKSALKFLRAQSVIVISTVSPDGEPQSATVNFITDEDFNIYFATRKSSRKFKNITSNPKVSVVAGFDVERPSTLQVQGAAEVVTENKISKLIELGEGMLAHEHNWWPLLRVTGLDFAIIKITPDWARWLRFDVDPKSGKYNEEYDQVFP